MRWSFRTNGNFIDFVHTDETSLAVENVIVSLHNTSRAVSWSLPEDTTRISFTIDEVKYSNILITDIDFDGTAMNSQDDFQTGIEAMFPGLAGGGAGELGYLVYEALLTQSGTDAPIATVLQNTLGETLTWSRSGAGFYKATAGAAIFPVAKTTITGIISTIGAILNASNDENGEPSDRIYIGTSHHDGTQSDNLLYISPVEIKVYP